MHTPGPWQAEDFGTEHPFSILADRNGESLPIAYLNDVDAEGYHVTWANARLIAAAPELLAALKRCLTYGDLLPELTTEARAAITKAEDLTAPQE